MDTDTTPTAELDVLTDEELAGVVGGGDVNVNNAREVALRTIGICGCGVAH